jgi:hypothetical protein
MEDKTMSRLLSHFTIGEMASNRNTGPDVSNFLLSLQKDQMFATGQEAAKPILILLDCAAQQESGALTASAKEMKVVEDNEDGVLSAFTKKGKETTRISYGNYALLHLLHLDFVIADRVCKKEQKDAAVVILEHLLNYVGVCLKECKSHVYRAPPCWMQRRGSKIQGLRTSTERFKVLFKAVFSHVLDIPSISEAMARMSVVIAVLETDRLRRRHLLNLVKYKRKGSAEKAKEHCAWEAIEEFVKSEAANIQIQSIESVEQKCADVSDEDHLILHDGIIKRAKAKLKPCIVFLKNIATDDGTAERVGTLRASIVIGGRTDQGLARPMIEGGFDINVPMPHCGTTGVRNPLYSMEVANYLRTERLSNFSFGSNTNRMARKRQKKRQVWIWLLQQ